MHTLNCGKELLENWGKSYSTLTQIILGDKKRFCNSRQLTKFMKHDGNMFSVCVFYLKNDIKLLFEISNKCMQFWARFHLNFFFTIYKQSTELEDMQLLICLY